MTLARGARATVGPIRVRRRVGVRPTASGPVRRAARRPDCRAARRAGSPPIRDPAHRAARSAILGLAHGL